MFEDPLVAIGFPEAELFPDALAKRKAALLRESLATDGVRLYASLTTNARYPYHAAVTRLRILFAQPARHALAITRSTRHQQRPGKSVTIFVAALPEWTCECEFTADQLDGRVEDQFASWC